MVALVLMDHALRQRAQNADAVVPTPRIAASATGRKSTHKPRALRDAKEDDV